MRRATIARVVVAAAASLVAATAAATPPSPAPAEASVIPIPATVTPRPGSFIVRAATPIYTSGDAESARIAAYLADLVHRTHVRHARAPSGAQPGTPPCRWW